MDREKYFDFSCYPSQTKNDLVPLVKVDPSDRPIVRILLDIHLSSKSQDQKLKEIDLVLNHYGIVANQDYRPIEQEPDDVELQTVLDPEQRKSYKKENRAFKPDIQLKFALGISGETIQVDFLDKSGVFVSNQCKVTLLGCSGQIATFRISVRSSSDLLIDKRQNLFIDV